MMTAVSFPVIDLQQTGRNIERRRRDAGMSVRELQTYFGFEYPQAIYKWQHGECLPTVDNLLALSRILQVKMEDLLVYEDREVSFCALIISFILHGAIPVTSVVGYARRTCERVLNSFLFRSISPSVQGS